MKKEVVILIPAYEPDMKMISLLDELNKHKLRVIIVNDGSGPDYDKIFNKAKKYAEVLGYEVNRGKGNALKTGFDYINNNIKNECFVVTMDCDGQHKVSDALKLCEYLKDNPNTLVLGKRIRNGVTPIRSKIGNSITRFVYKIITGIDVYDTQTGLRAFSSNLIPYMLEIRGDRFEYEMNVLLNCSCKNIKIKEIEIETIYIDNNSHSHFKTIKDSILIYKEIFKFLASSLCSFIIDYSLYSIIVYFSNSLILSNVIARLVSSIFNYNINRKVVFKSTNKGIKPIIKYYLLASIILVLNTLILYLLVNIIDMNKYVSKIFTEIVLFIFSLFFQKRFVFAKDEELNGRK